MRCKLLAVAIAAILFSCNDKLSDKDKRNEHWAWWVDATTGKSGWIPVGGNGPRLQNGEYTTFYFNGNIYEKGKVVDGHNTDTIFHYDINGHLQLYRMLSKDADTSSEGKNALEYFVKDGPTKMYFSNGHLNAAGMVKNHTYGNRWKSYFANNRLQYLRDAKSDTGWGTWYYDNGKIKDSDYNEGQNIFNIKHWYVTGQLAKSTDFKNHNYNGQQREYYLNGRMKFICPINDGKLNGQARKWYEDGHLMEVSYRKDDKLNGGPDTLYYQTGKVKAILMDIKDDKPDGEVKQYDETGKLIADKIVREGVVIENKLKAP